MRFSVLTVSMLAGAAMAATSTDYVTEEVTITSCAATVTNCPARSTQVSTTVYPKTTTDSAPDSSVTPAGSPSSSVPEYSAPIESAPASSAPAPSATGEDSGVSILVPVASSPAYSAGSLPAAGSSQPAASTLTPVYATSSTSALGVDFTPVGSSVSVIAITTCIPTVIYSTVTNTGSETGVPGAPESTAGSNSGLTTPGSSSGVSSVPDSPAQPSGTGSISYSGNVTSPSATNTPLPFTGAAANVQIGGAAIAAIFGVVAFLL